MSDPNALFQVNNVINKLEQSQRTQTDMDSIYEDWCIVIKQHMYSTVPIKLLLLVLEIRNVDLANHGGLIIYQISGLKCVRRDCSLRHNKIKHKSICVRLRKTFDREVQKAKRLYRYTIQNNLLNDCESDSSTFWKSKMFWKKGKTIVAPCLLVKPTVHHSYQA